MNHGSRPAGTTPGIARPAASAYTRLSAPPFEWDLEDYLEAHLSLPDEDVLVIGRQVVIVGGAVDLLAIDSTGVIYIIELKREKAQPSIISQVLRYRRSIKRLNREEVIRRAAKGKLKIDLEEAFQRHFGHPLPEAVNQSQVIVIIAASIHSEAALAILELIDEGFTIATFRYVRAAAVRLVPCCRNDQDIADGSHEEDQTRAAPNRIVEASLRSQIYRAPDENVRLFWSTQAPLFMPFVTFRLIYERYLNWAHAHEAEGARPRQEGLFGRDISAIVAESSEWSHVWVPRSDVAAYETTAAPPTAQTYRAYNHVSAYQRTSNG